MSSTKHPKTPTSSSIDCTKDPVTTHEERTVIDMKKTTTKHTGLSQYSLQIHALSRADTVALIFVIGKKKALNTLLNFNKKDESKKNSTKQVNNK